MRTLDVGCGNGRFGLFLREQFAGPLVYHGLDNNATLLAAAANALRTLPDLTATLEKRDIVEDTPDKGEYDLVVAFGLMHHIPGAANRLRFVEALAQSVAPGGILAFACWRFYEQERFRHRIVSWPHDLAADVEAHDYLLDWRRGDRALRYCHYVDDTEHEALVAASGLTVIETFRDDGATGDLNAYSLLKK